MPDTTFTRQSFSAGEVLQRARQVLAVQDEDHALLLGHLLQGSPVGLSLGQCLCQQSLALGVHSRLRAVIFAARHGAVEVGGGHDDAGG